MLGRRPRLSLLGHKVAQEDVHQFENIVLLQSPLSRGDFRGVLFGPGGPPKGVIYHLPRLDHADCFFRANLDAQSAAVAIVPSDFH